MIKIGLVIGKFQPLHPGHTLLIETAFRENDKIVVCIGSAQKADPLPVKERRSRIVEKLNVLGYDAELYKIVELDDINSDEKWPSYLKEECGITNETKNAFYTSDDLPESYLRAMRDLGFQIRTIARGSFRYRDPNGISHIVFSATEIREIHEGLNLAV
ncbi:MAG: adenylyltransferase/cytidyltransferase family protein [Patescibacteria group bacterium]|nr:adenylyltransferase/cytidyltransferase family protein [Patescibacteria group bacterium]